MKGGKMSKENIAMKEASILIATAKSNEELNKIAYKYWGTAKAPIKEIGNIMLMANAVQERRSIIGNQMGDNKNPEGVEDKP